jgi:hypothetical protein
VGRAERLRDAALVVVLVISHQVQAAAGRRAPAGRFVGDLGRVDVVDLILIMASPLEGVPVLRYGVGAPNV